ncbi:hypothetical protein [Qipengyuania flava]|uniref:hypothetical protein n=1 Tax=Qipengyuania flava TaxID=192812 RepID=UPI001C62F5A2|nr:hypothetical protein [Qipengyuania flava]QYJ05997.1 hypothetical protein KUV82_07770 [Qipengyuania flava]
MRGAADEAEHPKYAHLEIERRWLVDADKLAHADLGDPVAIHDRYIEGTRMRLRRMERGGATVFKLTRKYECDEADARPIVTAYLEQAEHEVFASLPALELTKTRFKLAHGENVFSIDRFNGALEGLMLAEIEMDDLAALRALPDPPWAVRDVTHELPYQGATLARAGIPKD